jgi:uncharacterized protein YqhQ
MLIAMCITAWIHSRAREKTRVLAQPESSDCVLAADRAKPDQANPDEAKPNRTSSRLARVLVVALILLMPVIAFGLFWLLVTIQATFWREHAGLSRPWTWLIGYVLAESAFVASWYVFVFRRTSNASDQAI